MHQWSCLLRESEEESASSISCYPVVPPSFPCSVWEGVESLQICFLSEAREQEDKLPTTNKEENMPWKVKPLPLVGPTLIPGLLSQTGTNGSNSLVTGMGGALILSLYWVLTAVFPATHVTSCRPSGQPSRPGETILHPSKSILRSGSKGSPRGSASSTHSCLRLTRT